MMRPQHDVLISGAGPAGIATAVALVRQDPSLRSRLVVIDRATFPRQKPCGGGLTGHVEENMAALGLQLDVAHVASPDAIVRFGSYERRVALARPVRVIRREDFDASLVKQARDLGIEIKEGVGLRDLTVKRNHVEVVTDEGVTTARIVVGADGAPSPVRKKISAEFGLDKERPIRLFRLEIPLPRDFARQEFRRSMLYDFSAMTRGLRGYLWIFPVADDRLNVGLMHDPEQPQSGAALTALLHSELREKYGIELAQPARGWPAWGYNPERAVASQRTILVGDAAGIDALTGEGIAIALAQGRLAATAIARALDDGDFNLAPYTHTLARSVVGRELALDARLARMLYHGDAWKNWLSLVLYDDTMLSLYADRVCGSLVLSSEWLRLGAAFVRHIVGARGRQRALARDWPIDHSGHHKVETLPDPLELSS